MGLTTCKGPTLDKLKPEDCMVGSLILDSNMNYSEQYSGSVKQLRLRTLHCMRPWKRHELHHKALRYCFSHSFIVLFTSAPCFDWLDEFVLPLLLWKLTSLLLELFMVHTEQVSSMHAKTYLISREGFHHRGIQCPGSRSGRPREFVRRHQRQRQRVSSLF